MGSRAKDFSELRLREWNSDKHNLWLAEIEKYLNDKTNLKILDIGTETGYFAFLLGSRGHDVTGIDLTKEIIEEAKKTSELLGIKADFYQMDAENPEFEAESFDVIVTRNLTWQLPHLKEAYEKWYGLLKDNGIVINFDADYCREHNEEVLLPKNHAHASISDIQKAEYEHMKAELHEVQNPRPTWDVEIMKEIGYKEIAIDDSVWERLYAEKDEFYNPTKTFCITGRK